jgi:ribosome-binding protein aMBF1 (putative translation factor)
MPKYSTGGSGGGDGGDACELCGRETTDLGQANVAGATLLVCSACRSHDDAGNAPSSADDTSDGPDHTGTGGGSTGTRSRTQELANKQARMYDAATGGSDRWEAEGTSYEDDQLPYLVADYGDRTTEARQAAGLTVEELAAELDVDEQDLLAIEDGRAATATVGGSVVHALADQLDVTLVDE